MPNYALVIDAPHGESGGTMVKRIDTHSLIEVVQNIAAVTEENPGQEIVFKVTATKDVT